MQEFYHEEQPPQPRRRKRFPPAQPGHKHCNTCFQEKPHEAFKRDSAQKDGYAGRCKECYKARWNALSEEEKERLRCEDRERRIPKLEQRRAYDRQRHNTDEHRAKRRARNATKREAHLLELKQNSPIPKNATQMDMFKTCPRCQTEKFMSEFSLNKKTANGYSVYCKECQRKWANSEEEKARQRKIRQEKRRSDPIYAQAIRDKLNKWRRNNPLSQQELTLRRNARKKAATTERVNYKRIIERDGYYCYICDKTIDPHAKKRSPESLTFDHVIPIQPRDGEPQGTHCESNIKPAHKVCNARKSNKPFEALTNFDRQGP